MSEALYTTPIVSCHVCGASWAMPRDKPHDCTVRAAQAERDHWIRLFNRLEAAVSHHKRSDEWKNDIDVALYKARDKILSDAASGEGGSA